MFVPFFIHYIILCVSFLYIYTFLKKNSMCNMLWSVYKVLKLENLSEKRSSYE